MTRFVTVKRNVRNQAVPVNRKRYSVSRKVTAKDLLKWQPQKIGKLVASTRRIGPNGEHIEIQGAVAPRME